MQEAINAAVDFAESGKVRLLHTLEHVPDDKLNWSPGGGAHSALRVAAHAALSNQHFAMMMRGDPMPDMPFDQMRLHMDAAESALATREQVVQTIEAGAAAVIDEIKKLTPEKIAGEVKTPFGAMPMKFIMTLVGRHMDGHASQIDYLQTLWGDPVSHF